MFDGSLTCKTIVNLDFIYFPKWNERNTGLKAETWHGWRTDTWFDRTSLRQGICVYLNMIHELWECVFYRLLRFKQYQVILTQGILCEKAFERCDISAASVLNVDSTWMNDNHRLWRGESPALFPYLFFCRGLMMLGLSMAPRPAAGSAPALGFAPWPLTPAGPHLPSRGGACRLGCPLVRAPQVVRVTGGYRPPPSGRAAGQVCAGLHAICGLEMLKINK